MKTSRMPRRGRRKQGEFEDAGLDLVTSPADRHDARDEIWAEDEEVSGWSTGARANTSAVLRWTLWGLLLLSPLTAAAAYLKPATATPSAAAPQSAPAAGSQGAAGFAELFVDAYLRAGEGDEQQLAAFYPAAATVRLEGEERPAPQNLTVVRLRQAEERVWSVTIAARLPSTPPQEDESAAGAEKKPATEGQDSGDAPAGEGEPAAAVRYFQVSIASAQAPGGTTGYTALAMPAEVTAPPGITAPRLAYGPAQSGRTDDAKSQAVTAFLSSYLTGEDALERYLAPGTRIPALRPAPYTEAVVEQVALAPAKGPAAGATPRDGAQVRLLATVRATGRDDVVRPLAYALTLTARDGRWEIAALDAAPATAPTPRPAPSTTPR